MYGTDTTAAATGGTLAITGLTVGAGVLAVIGLICAGVAIIALARRHRGRP